MAGIEQRTNPYETPMRGHERGSASSLAFAVFFVGCIALVLVSISVSGHAILKILDTTPVFGIPVDANGDPIPVQGYPQLGLGLAGVFLFSVLAVLLGLHRLVKADASYRRIG